MPSLPLRFTWTRLGVGLLLAGGAALFAGCSGSDDADLFGTPTTNGDDASTSTGDDTTNPGSNDGDDDGKDGDDGSGTDEPDASISSPDASSVTDAGGDPVVDGGTDDGGATTALSPTPGKVSCGDTQCDTPSNVCCSSTSLCWASNLVDEKYCFPVACDEAADCSNGQTCCLDNGKRPQSYCAASCKFGDTKLCQSNEECGSSACEAYTCPGFGSRAFHACSQPVFCSP